MRVIKVEEIGCWGQPTDLKYFESLNQAKRYVKKRLKYHKEVLTTKDECSYQEKPIMFLNMKHHALRRIEQGARYNVVNLEIWTKSESENGTEWDTEQITIVLQEIKIEPRKELQHELLE